MGWNSLNITPGSRLFKGIEKNPYVYFVHSYYLDAEKLLGRRYENGIRNFVRFFRAVPEINLYATQFHPEKSGRVGLKILENFAKLGGDTLVR